MRDVALYELGAVFQPGLVAGAPPAMGVDRRPTDEELGGRRRDRPAPAVARRGGAGRRVRPGRLVGPGPRGRAGRTRSRRPGSCCPRPGIPADRVAVRAAEYAPWHPGRCAEILVDDAVVGHAGELHPAVLSALELPRRTCAMELDLDALPAAPVTPAPAALHATRRR